MPGLAGALGLIFIDTRFIVTLQRVFFSCLRRGEQAKQQRSAKQALSIQLYKRYPAILVNIREKMVSSACNKVFEPQIAICQ